MSNSQFRNFPIVINRLIVLLLLLFISSGIKGQSKRLVTLYPEIMDSLHFYQSYDKPISQYGIILRKLEVIIYEDGDSHAYKALRPYLDWMVQHPKADSSILRTQHAAYAYYMAKATNDIKSTIELYEIAHEYGGNLLNLTDYYSVEKSLGSQYNQTGNHEKSEYYYKLALKGIENLIKKCTGKDKKEYLSQRIRTRKNLGLLYIFDKKPKKAAKILHASIHDAKMQSNPNVLAFAYSHLGRMHEKLGKIDSTQKYIRLLKEIMPKLAGDKKLNIEHLTDNLSAATSMLTHDYDNARKLYLKILQKTQTGEGGKNTRESAKIYNNLAKVYLKMDSTKQAKSAIKKGLSALSLELDDVMQSPAFLYEENSIAELLETNADYHKKLYIKTKKEAYLDFAVTSINRSLFVYNLLREQYILEGAKLNAIAKNRELVEYSIDLLFLKQKKFGTNSELTKQAESLFAKSKNLLLAALNKERQVIKNLPPEKRKEIENLQSQILALTQELSDKRSTQIPSGISEKLLEHREAITKIIGKNQEKKENHFDESYVEYLLGKQYLYSVDNLSGDKVFRRLAKREEVMSLITKSQQGILNKDPSNAFYKVQFELYNVLLGNLGELPSRFTILPDDLLFFVSFPALVTTLATDEAEKQFLIQDHIIKTGYDKSKAIHQNASKKNHLIAIAPDYDGKQLYAMRDRGDIVSLPYAKYEIDSIANIWMGTLSKYRHVTKDVFFILLGEASTFHFAGHALAKGDDAYLYINQDTTIKVHHNEIAKATSLPHTVVLSACETGLGELAYGEGINSLAKSFLLGGTQSIVYSLWSVEDKTTAELMASFYTYQNEGKTLATALAYAQREHLNNFKGPKAHPFYWAAFVVVDSSSQGNIFEITLAKGLLFLGILALIGVIYFFIKNKRK